MAQTQDILAQLLHLGYTDNEIIIAIRQATNPNDINEILDIINTKQQLESAKSANPKQQEKKEQEQEQEQVLPPRWGKYYTEHGKIYYKNHYDGSIYWNIPKEAYWRKCYTKDGKEYWQCHRDKKTYWQLPKGIKITGLIKQAKPKYAPKQPPQIISNKQIPNKYVPNKQNKKESAAQAKPKRDAAYFNRLAQECAWNGDLSQLIKEMRDYTYNSEEYKNGTPQQQHAMQQQLESQIQQINNQQLQHQQNMINSTFQNHRNIMGQMHATNMNILSSISGTGPKYHYYWGKPHGY